MRGFWGFGVLVLAFTVGACGDSTTGSGRMNGSGGMSGSGGSVGTGGSVGAGGASGMGGAGDAGGSDGVSGSAGTGGTPAAGVCDNTGDLDAMANAGDSLRSIGGDCGANSCFGQIGNPVAFGACVSDCIETNVGVSSDCAACYGGVGECGLSAFCLACSSDTCSKACLDCLNGANCLTTLDTCTGIPAEICP